MSKQSIGSAVDEKVAGQKPVARDAGDIDTNAGKARRGSFMSPAKPGREYRDRVSIERFTRAQILLEGGKASQVLGLKLLNAHPWQPFDYLANPAYGLTVGREVTAAARAAEPDAAKWYVLAFMIGHRWTSPNSEALGEGQDIAGAVLQSKRLKHGPAVGWLRFDYDPLGESYEMRLTALVRADVEVARREFETNLGIEGLDACFAGVRRLRHWRVDVLDVAIDFGAARWTDVRPTARKRILSPLSGAPARRVLKFLHRTAPHEFVVERDLELSERLLPKELLEL